jgi:hypothetical protein
MLALERALMIVSEKTAIRAYVSHFRRELLPAARAFYEAEIGKLGRESRGWCKALCPFHPDHNPSLSVNLQSGSYFCFACRAKGGNLIDFVMARYSLDFKAAAQRLGAWQDLPDSHLARAAWAEMRKKKERIGAAVTKLEAAERALRFSIRHELHALEQMQREIIARLDMLGDNPEQETEQESEICWRILALIPEELRKTIAGFYLLAFGSEVERAEFLLSPETREGRISAILDRGYVTDDKGRWNEVPVE